METDAMSLHSPLNDFLTAARDASEILLQAAASAEEEVEAQDLILSLMSVSLDILYHHGAVDAPELVSITDSSRKYYGDNPDANYLSAPVNPNNEYQISGEVGNALYVGVTFYSQEDGQTRAFQGPAFRPKPGEPISIEMRAHSDSAEGSAFPSQNIQSLVLREYFESRSGAVAGRYEIQSNCPSDGVDSGRAARLSKASRFVKSAANKSAQFVSSLAEMEPNVFVRDTLDTFFPTPDNDYALCLYELEEGQALEITGDVPTGAWYWSFTAMNVWLQSLDYRRGGPASLNGSEIQRSDSGFRIIAGEQRPDSWPNWLDTGGARRGLILARSLGDHMELPQASVVGL